MKRYLTVVLTLALGGVGCDEGEDLRLSKWEGSTPHLKILGTLNGEALSVDVPAEVAADPARSWCERQYAVPRDRDVAGRLTGVRVKAVVEVNGARRRLELELMRPYRHQTRKIGDKERDSNELIQLYDLQRESAGAVIAIVPRIESRPLGPSELWLQWNWFLDDASDTMLFAEAAQEGRFTLGDLSGAPGVDGLVIPAQEGMVGGHVDALWSENDRLRLSFTVKCAASEVEQID